MIMIMMLMLNYYYYYYYHQLFFRIRMFTNAISRGVNKTAMKTAMPRSIRRVQISQGQFFSYSVARLVLTRQVIGGFFLILRILREY